MTLRCVLSWILVSAAVFSAAISALYGLAKLDPFLCSFIGEIGETNLLGIFLILLELVVGLAFMCATLISGCILFVLFWLCLPGALLDKIIGTNTMKDGFGLRIDSLIGS